MNADLYAPSRAECVPCVGSSIPTEIIRQNYRMNQSLHRSCPTPVLFISLVEFSINQACKTLKLELSGVSTEWIETSDYV